MKKLILCLISIFLISCGGSSDSVSVVQRPTLSDSDIPHYKYYPRTPIVDYTDDVLDFYSVKDSYGEFSNFAYRV